jgi:putative phosphoribosyl transferase
LVTDSVDKNQIAFIFQRCSLNYACSWLSQLTTSIFGRRNMRFINRKESGLLLANKLLKLELDKMKTVVIALPRGGVPVAYEVAKKLNLPLDIVLVKKIGAPFNPELAVGAVSEDDEVYYNMELLKYLGYGIEEVSEYKNRALDILKANASVLRKNRVPLDLKAKDIILVDDGIATGSTIEVVVKLLRRKKTGKIIVATPVSSPDALKRLGALVDQVVAVIVPPVLCSVGEWYEDFSQVDSNSVIDILNNYLVGNRMENPFEVKVKDGDVILSGIIYRPENDQVVRSWIVFAHGSGSTYKSVRNNLVAHELVKAGHGVLLFDLLTTKEDMNFNNRFDIPLLAGRLLLATKWLKNTEYYHHNIPIGYFGASTGAAAALTVSANDFINDSIYAIVSHGGRPDMVDKMTLRSLRVPTLLIVGGDDSEVISLNEKAKNYLSNSQIYIVPHATHLFEELGAMEEVVSVAVGWFNDHLDEYLNIKMLVNNRQDELSYMIT